MPDPKTKAATLHTLQEAAGALAEGAIVAFPTETFYGLAVRPDRPVAVERLAKLKGRGGALPMIATDLATARRWGDIPTDAEPLAKRFWPGALTLVVPPAKGRMVPEALLGPSRDLAIRISPHPVAAELARAAGGMITATSANPRGAPPVTTAIMLASEIVAAVALVLDGGATPGGEPSSIIGLETGEKEARFVLYREGAIHASELASTLGYTPALTTQR